MDKLRISTIIFDAGGVLMYYKRKRNAIVRGLLTSMNYDPFSIEVAINEGEDFDVKYFEDHKQINNWKEEKEWLLSHYTKIAATIDEGNEFLADKLFMLTFDTNEYVLYPEVIEILEELKERHKLGVISNCNPSLDWAFSSLGIRRFFDDIVISAYERIEKPDKEIYIRSMKNLGSKAEECIFIDDRIENVRAAEELGMMGLHLKRDENESLRTLVDLLEQADIESAEASVV